MVVPTSAVVCGRADGLHRPIERFRFEWLSNSIGPDAGPDRVGAGTGQAGERVVFSFLRRRDRAVPR